MMYTKHECENGWIVFVVYRDQVLEIHSTGLVMPGNDDRCQGGFLIRQLEDDAESNFLHSQQPGRCGVRWPERR